jgi:hypothetical protein
MVSITVVSVVGQRNDGTPDLGGFGSVPTPPQVNGPYFPLITSALTRTADYRAGHLQEGLWQLDRGCRKGLKLSRQWRL